MERGGHRFGRPTPLIAHPEDVNIPRPIPRDLKGKTLGIVGLGAIGADVARFGAGVGMNLRPRGGARALNYLFASLPTVLLMPHIARNSKEGGENVLRIAYATFDAFLKGETPHVVEAA